MQCPKWPTPGKIRRCGLVGYDFWVCRGQKELTSACSMSEGLVTHTISKPTFSIALVRERIFPLSRNGLARVIYGVAGITHATWFKR